VTAIDPDMVIDERGDPWLAWGSFWGGIALAPIDPATAKLTPGAVPTIVAKRPRWFDGIEGPNIVLRDGWWWLFTAWGFCCQGLNSHYAIRVGRSRALAGPYLDMAGRPLLEGGGTLLLGSHGDRHGVGHGTAFESPHGWTMAHHYYSRSNDGRQTLGFVPMVELDGWPLGIEPDATLADEPKPLAAGTWRVIPYPENDDPRQSTPPATSTVGLRSDGSVAGGGRWWSDENVVRVEATAMRGTGGTVPRTRLALLVDAGGAVAFGRDQDGAALRLERTGPEPGPDPVPVPVPSPPTGASAAPPAAPVRAAPAYVG
jgi:beta-xylosidase